MARYATALALLLAASVSEDRLVGQPSAKEPLLKAAGELTRDDPVDSVLRKGFHKVYTVKLAAGAYYQIDLVSKDFDAYLRLEDSSGKPLAEDDDSGGELNARLVYKADQTAQFRIIVTTYDAAKTGTFRLTVTETDRTALEQQSLKQAHAVNAQGVQFYKQAKLPEAAEHLRQALALYRRAFPKDRYPQGHPDLASSLDNLGFVLWMQGEYAKAEPHLHAALVMREAVYPKARYPQGHPDLSQSLNNVGAVLKAQGEYAKAEPLYRAALAMDQALYPKANYPQGHWRLAASLNNVGSVLVAQGDFAKAEPLLRDALAMNEALYPQVRYPHGHPKLAYSLDNVGVVLREQGEYARAEPLLRKALVMRQALYAKATYPKGHPDLAQSHNNLGILLVYQWDFARAEPQLGAALAMREDLYPKAKYPQGHPDLARSLNDLGRLLVAKGEYARAEPLLRGALAMYEVLYPEVKYPQGHPALATSRHNLGFVLREQGEYAKAEPLLRAALATRQALYPQQRYPQGHPDLAVCLNSLGGLLQARGEYVKAELPRRQAVEMYAQLASHLAQLATEPVALNAAAMYPWPRDGLLSVAKHLPGSDAQTHAALWQSRAALTRVYQRRHLALIAAATDPSVRTAWDDLLTLRREREQLIMAPTPRDSAERDRKLGQLNERIDSAERGLMPHLPALKHNADLDRLGPDALQQRLAADAVLVDLLRYIDFEYDPAKPGAKGENATLRYLAFVVSGAGVQRVELGTAAQIEPVVRQWRAAITAKAPAGNEAARREHAAKLARQAAALRRLLWEPIEQRLPAGAATIYLAPDAELTQLPWAALPSKTQDRVLLDDYALAVLPHGPFLLEQLMPAPPRSAKRPPAAPGLLLAGGIRYDDKPGAAVLASRGAEGVVDQPALWHYLPGTDAERQLLAQLLEQSGPKVSANLSGAEAATGRLRKELERCRYAHLATHGFFANAKFRSILQLDEKLFNRTEWRMGESLFIGQRIGAGARSPLVLSGLVCAGANRPETPERGILSGDAIAGLLLDDLYLATLSACDTGIGDVAGGEGVFGLQRAFHIAGCKNVVASLWKVDDAATAALMMRFYGHLFGDKLPPIEALRRAQLELYRHPELIGAWAKGEQRGPGKARPATTPAPPNTPRDWLTSEGRAPIRLWAAFTLSGAGR